MDGENLLMILIWDMEQKVHFKFLINNFAHRTNQKKRRNENLKS